MERLRAWVERDPGRALLVLALIAAAALYAPTLSRGMVNYDDPWLYHNNYVLKSASLDSLRTIFFDFEYTAARHALGSEYLPIRDLSVMLDFALWGEHYGYFHLTNLLVYLASIALVFSMLDAFGIGRTTAGLAVLVWAIHPTHAESVAWLAERKGVLAIAFAAAAGLGYAKFRAGGRPRWLVLAAICAVCAVWSKAPAAFTIASFAGLEVVLPERRVSWRRSLCGLGTLAAVTALAFVPVMITASGANIVGESPIPASRLATAIGVHGFYLELGALAKPNAITYPIIHAGPTALELIIGGLGLVAALVALAPRIGPRRVPGELRAAAVLWLVPFIPVSHLVTSLPRVVADRYVLVMTLGLALAIAVAITHVQRRQLQLALAAVICIACGLRTWDAQSNWDTNISLWQRAVQSNPGDQMAWSTYAAVVVEETGDPVKGLAILERALEHGRPPHVLLRRAQLIRELGDRPAALAAMREAAATNDPSAMANLADLLLAEGAPAEALDWARRSTANEPMHVFGHRTQGIAALRMKQLDEAERALRRAIALDPKAPEYRYFLGLTLLEIGKTEEARGELSRCVSDPYWGRRASAVLDRVR